MAAIQLKISGGRLFRLSLLIVASLCLAACAREAAAPPPPSPYKSAGDVKFVMAMILDPATDVIWGAAGQIVTADGVQDLSPTTDEGWLLVQQSAAVVAESGNLLMMPDRARDGGDWIEISQGLVAAGQRAMKAASDKDAEAVFNVGAEIYNICTSCHQLYMLPADSK
jgi:hypothetical protein